MPPIEKLLYTIFSCFSSALSGIVKKKMISALNHKNEPKIVKKRKKTQQIVQYPPFLPTCHRLKKSVFSIYSNILQVFQESSRTF